MRCIAVINQKGGVGKTTSTVNLGAALARGGQRVLLVDLDPQAHLTAHLGIDTGDGRPGMYEVLSGDADLAAAIRSLDSHLSVIAGSIDLAGAEVELAGTIGREVIFRDLLAVQPLPYDWCLIDCPPSLGVLTLNALCAAREVLIPLQPHFLALQGVGKLFETIVLVSRRINPGLIVLGVVLCMHEAGTRLAAEVEENVREYVGSAATSRAPWRNARIFATRIRRNVKLAESPSFGQTIFAYAPRSNGAEDYLALAEELRSIAAPSHEPGETATAGRRGADRSEPPAAPAETLVGQADTASRASGS